MIIFLYGSDDYRRRERTKYYIAEFRKKYSDLSVERFDCMEPESVGRFQEFARGQSMFSAFTMAVLENVFEAEDDKELIKELRRLAKTGPEVTILISETRGATEGFDFLKKHAKTKEEFKPLEGREQLLFVKTKAKEFGVPLTAEAVSFLAAVHEGDSWRLVTELQKLSFLEKKAIDQKELEKFDLEITPNFWNLLTALKSWDREKRLAALETIFAENEPAQKVFHMLAYQWPEKLENFAKYDVAIKAGKLGYEEALVDLVL